MYLLSHITFCNSPSFVSDHLLISIFFTSEQRKSVIIVYVCCYDYIQTAYRNILHIDMLLGIVAGNSENNFPVLVFDTILVDLRDT